MRYHPGCSRSDYNLSRFDVVFILNYLYFSTWKCKYFEMQNPAILQVKILAGNFASPGGRPGKPVGCVWWVSAEYLPTKISFWVSSVVLLADGFSYFLFKRQENSVNKSGQIQEQHHLRSRGIDDGSSNRGAKRLMRPSESSPPSPHSGLRGLSTPALPSPPVKPVVRKVLGINYDANVCFLKNTSPLPVILCISQGLKF